MRPSCFDIEKVANLLLFIVVDIPAHDHGSDSFMTWDKAYKKYFTDASYTLTKGAHCNMCSIDLAEHLGKRGAHVSACKQLGGYQKNKAHPCKKEIYCGPCFQQKQEAETGGNRGRTRQPNQKFAAV